MTAMSTSSVSRGGPGPGTGQALHSIVWRAGKVTTEGIPLERVSEELALLDAGDFTAVYGQMEGRPRKPDPTSVFELTQKMGVEPADCVYMGDSIVDYETAVNAGMLPLLCMWGFGDTARLRTLEDALCIEGPEELLPHLEDFSDGEGL